MHDGKLREFICPECEGTELRVERTTYTNYTVVFNENGSIDYVENVDESKDSITDDEMIFRCGECGAEILKGTEDDLVQYLENQEGYRGK